METKDVILQIDEFKTFVPSYEKPLKEEQIEPSTGQKIIEKAVTAAVWTGVLSRIFQFSKNLDKVTNFRSFTEFGSFILIIFSHYFLYQE